MLNDPPVWFYRWSSVVWNDYSPLYQRNNWIHVKCDRIVWGWKNRVYTNDEGQHVCQFRISFKPRMISCMFMSSPESSVRMMCMISFTCHWWLYFTGISFQMCNTKAQVFRITFSRHWSQIVFFWQISLYLLMFIKFWILWFTVVGLLKVSLEDKCHPYILKLTVINYFL